VSTDQTATDDAVLASVLRRFLTEEDEWHQRPYCDAEPGDRSCTLDGHVQLEEGEAEVLHRIHTADAAPAAQLVWTETRE
jgi:hypothetical protein